mmetsp:Transcript_12270/g.21003  ORF Transcript_12270/g.21003 Transcript_12270/m.21003 type:complete len:220 (-) Transcript_12270:65-724(-)
MARGGACGRQARVALVGGRGLAALGRKPVHGSDVVLLVARQERPRQPRLRPAADPGHPRAVRLRPRRWRVLLRAGEPQGGAQLGERQRRERDGPAAGVPRVERAASPAKGRPAPRPRTARADSRGRPAHLGREAASLQLPEPLGPHAGGAVHPDEARRRPGLWAAAARGRRRAGPASARCGVRAVAAGRAVARAGSRGGVRAPGCAASGETRVPRVCDV